MINLQKDLILTGLEWDEYRIIYISTGYIDVWTLRWAANLYLNQISCNAMLYVFANCLCVGAQNV